MKPGDMVSYKDMLVTHLYFEMGDQAHSLIPLSMELDGLRTDVKKMLTYGDFNAVGIVLAVIPTLDGNPKAMVMIGNQLGWVRGAWMQVLS